MNRERVQEGVQCSRREQRVIHGGFVYSNKNMWIVLIKLSPVIQSTTITSRLFTPPAKHIPSNYNYSRLIQPWDKEKQFNGIDSGGVRSNTCCLPLGEQSEE